MITPKINILTIKKYFAVFESPLLLYSLEVIKLSKPRQENIIGCDTSYSNTPARPRNANKIVETVKIIFNPFI